MPYPDQHVARIHSPLRFIDESFARMRVAPGVSIIVGTLRIGSTDGLIIQSYLFDRNIFKASKAVQWLKDHKISYVTFEPAIHS